MKSKDDELLRHLKDAIRHIDDAVEKVKEDRLHYGVDCDIEDAMWDLRMAMPSLIRQTHGVNQ